MAQSRQFFTHIFGLEKLGHAEEYLGALSTTERFTLSQNVKQLGDELAALARLVDNYLRIMKNSAFLQHGCLFEPLERGNCMEFHSWAIYIYILLKKIIHKLHIITTTTYKRHRHLP